ncbi:MAG: hypothetical protein ACRC6O_08650 [Flavobacterium sp.]
MTRSIANDSTSGGSVPPTYAVLTGSGTYSSPVGASYLIVEMTGGGGGGGKQAGSNSGGGGCGSTYFKLRVPIGSYSYSVGSGGAGGSAGGDTGAAGTASTFGLASAGGGLGGLPNGPPGDFGSSNPSYTVLESISGARGGSRHSGSNLSSPGGQSFWGTAAGPISGTYVFSTSQFANAAGYGSGGAGTDNTNFSGPGGTGGDGRIVVTVFY